MSDQKQDLDVLIIDNDNKLSRLLMSIIEAYSIVKSTNTIPVHNALSYLKNNSCNTILIDPLAEDIELTSSLIFRIRKQYPTIIFVLFTDFTNMENNSYFFEGERRRFKHYFKLNKRTPLHLLDAELISTLYACQNDLNRKQQKIRAPKYKTGLGNNYELVKRTDLSIKVKNLIAIDQLDEALNEMKKYYETHNEDIYNELILLSLKYINSEKNRNIDTLSNSDYIQTKMQVANSLINILNRERKL